MVATNYDLVIIGGGIAGGALATVMARAGHSVLVLEKSEVYRDLVRGEWIAPWGVIEAQTLGLIDTFLHAGGHWVSYHAEFGDGIDIADAEAKKTPLAVLPGVPGPLCIGHPAACEALRAAAIDAGVTFLRNVDDVHLEAGREPVVRFSHEGKPEETRARLVAACDGRNSLVRRQLGFEMEQDEQHHWFSGLLVEGVPEWPEDLQTMGTHGDGQLFVFPQGGGRLRLYLGYPTEQKARLSGAAGEQRFLDAFRSPAMPHGDLIAKAKIAGPANSIPNQSTLVRTPYAPGVVLVGDAAGYNDPITGQGLSITLRDVRIVSDILKAAPDWAAEGLFAPYAEERAERMRRLRLCARLDSIVHAEFGEAAEARRTALRARRLADPSFMMCTAGVMIGPERLPAEVFDERIEDELIAMGTGA
jgi:2-polyprenyl-6-methoxyphenol hydroxylase-like FAD-dependent oxidoreductase